MTPPPHKSTLTPPLMFGATQSISAVEVEIRRKQGEVNAKQVTLEQIRTLELLQNKLHCHRIQLGLTHFRLNFLELNEDDLSTDLSIDMLMDSFSHAVSELDGAYDQLEQMRTIELIQNNMHYQREQLGLTEYGLHFLELNTDDMIEDDMLMESLSTALSELNNAYAKTSSTYISVAGRMPCRTDRTMPNLQPSTPRWGCSSANC